ncbi:NAD-dependent epimerase/dehydratase family protein [Curtobacterium sp. Leaf261]|uniref:NAD-dependent epimerase/dehydratase family protein n=1 Tax=Curtobacterium sp. Leaf261 TaxID=1736311 RepID=UPI0006F5E654|nr:NAD-dependent epimerase/dehydratase family protein [Curtobacterium sp. Leaf261]KQO60053.1 epimerase [Curtobacterium sp. Leaf261]
MPQEQSPEHVLVTGGSGFIAGHVILQLLDQGHTVRTTIRSLEKESAVRTVLERAGMTRGAALTFVAADLLHDDGWGDAAAGVSVVVHVASPVMPGAVADEQSVIGPALDGTLRVLRAARDAGVRRVVLTSAFHAVGFGHGRPDRVFTEADWSPLDGPGVDAYGRSKILAERAAWDFVAAEGGSMELITLTPVAVVGPVMGNGVSGANHIVQNILTGTMRAYPDLAIPVVDVRDVAAAHVAAVTVPEARGQRFIVGTGEPAVRLARIGAVLRAHLGGAASRVSTRRVPSVLIRIRALWDPAAKGVAADLGYVKRVSNERLRTVLGVEPRPAEEAIVAAGESMVAAGLVGPR